MVGLEHPFRHGGVRSERRPGQVRHQVHVHLVEAVELVVESVYGRSRVSGRVESVVE